MRMTPTTTLVADLECWDEFAVLVPFYTRINMLSRCLVVWLISVALLRERHRVFVCSEATEVRPSGRRYRLPRGRSWERAFPIDMPSMRARRCAALPACPQPKQKNVPLG